jgi:hypothetical protein
MQGYHPTGMFYKYFMRSYVLAPGLSVQKNMIMYFEGLHYLPFANNDSQKILIIFLAGETLQTKP